MIDKTKDRSIDQASRQGEKTSPAGPHDKPELTDKHKTPGSGMLSDSDRKDVEGPTG